MRKLINKFKNYNQVEIDDPHYLKEGDLALYKDKFITRLNSKVVELGNQGGTDEGTDENVIVLKSWTNGSGNITTYTTDTINPYNHSEITSSYNSAIDSIIVNIDSGRFIFNIPDIDLKNTYIILPASEYRTLYSDVFSWIGGLLCRPTTDTLKEHYPDANFAIYGRVVSNGLSLSPLIKYKKINGGYYYIRIVNMTNYGTEELGFGKYDTYRVDEFRGGETIINYLDLNAYSIQS